MALTMLPIFCRLTSSESCPLRICESLDCSALDSSCLYSCFPSFTVSIVLPLFPIDKEADLKLGTRLPMSIFLSTSASLTACIFSSLLLPSICIVSRSIVTSMCIKDSNKPCPLAFPNPPKAESEDPSNLVIQLSGVSSCSAFPLFLG